MIYTKKLVTCIHTYALHSKSIATTTKEDICSLNDKLNLINEDTNILN